MNTLISKISLFLKKMRALIYVPDGINVEAATLDEELRTGVLGTVHPKRVGVAVMLEFDNKYLVCRREMCRDMNGLLQFPGGGIESNEPAVIAADREVGEETGICSLYSCDYNYLETTVFVHDGNLFVTILYLVKLKVYMEVYNKEPEKHGDWQRLTKEEILAKPHIPVMKFWLDKYGI